MAAKEHCLWLLLWGLLLPAALCQRHRGYFILRVVSVDNPNGPFQASNNFLITAPSTPSHPVTIRQNSVTACPTKPTAIYLPSAIWLADWRIPETSSLAPSSTSTSAFSFFTRAKVAMEDVKTPLLRSLSAKTKSLVWGYLNADEGTAKEGRVELFEVPDGSRSMEGFREGEVLVDVDGLGSAESVRFLHDPVDPSAGSPNLQPNLTPPMSGSWITGTLDPSIKRGTAYFTACEPTTANAGTYHLFRAGITPLVRSENFFSLFYSSCEEVFIHAERVPDEDICFRWDMARETDVDTFSDLGEKRLSTLYHNSFAPSIPIVITPEVDDPPPSLSNPSPDNNINLNPNMNNYYIPTTRKASQVSNADRTISSITAVEDVLTDEDDNESRSFAQGLKDFMGPGRDTPAFGSTDNSESGSGNGGGSREGMNLPDEVNIVSSGAGGDKVTPGLLSDRISVPRELPAIRGGNRNRLAIPIPNLSGSPVKKENIQIQDYNAQFPGVPVFEPRKLGDLLQRSSGLDQGSNNLRPRPQALITSNPLLSIPSSRGSLPFVAEPKAAGLVPLKQLERKRESLVLPGIMGGRSGSIPSINGNFPINADPTKARSTRGYQPIQGLNVNALLPNIKGNSAQNTPGLESSRAGMRLLPLNNMEENDEVVETPDFPLQRKPAVKGSPMDMYITSDNLGFPVVLDRKPAVRPSIERGMVGDLNVGDLKRAGNGYADMKLPEGLKGRTRNRSGQGSFGVSIPASPRGSIPGSPKGLQGLSKGMNPGTSRNTNPRGSLPSSPKANLGGLTKNTNPGTRTNRLGGINTVNRSPRTRTPSPPSALRGNKAGSPGNATPRPRTPSPTSSGLKNTGRRTPSSLAVTVTNFNTNANNGANSRRKVREKLEVVNSRKIIEDRKKKSTIPRFKSSKDFVKWLREERGGNGSDFGEKRKLAGATARAVNTGN
ncbi:hypothetical protein TWF281_001407 [Arthrobotrys megalospora]